MTRYTHPTVTHFDDVRRQRRTSSRGDARIRLSKVEAANTLTAIELQLKAIEANHKAGNLSDVMAAHLLTEFEHLHKRFTKLREDMAVRGTT